MASTKKILQKTFIIASGLAFLGMMTVPMLTVLRGNANQNQTEAPSEGAPQQPTAAEIEQLKAIAEGYEKVLQREPDNPNALQGLVEARLQMGDLAGAITPMEKLTKIYPEEEGLKQLLAAIKLQVENPQLPPPQNPLAPADPNDQGGGTGSTPTPTQP
ncbi:M48 family metallopeptidase [Synechocystis sp. PCC 7338]|uniref:tetratricopeptide repeat protein n=1 Tax=Synechocystis sp. PCC 7338 TaxID=2732530 RepID=UPI001BAF2A99|nr:tetratricopeptide repeat protein [Synechocystis sp. PCC 7338]QUS59937.1 tetratricopeptide repeat protein [Synechocystis sp. PCC 7338]